MPPRRRAAVIALGLVVVGAGVGCEEWNVDSCTPVVLRIDAVTGSSVTVSLRSRDQSLRRQLVDVEARTDDTIVAAGMARSDSQGAATVELPPDALDQADEVVASYPGASGFCPATAHDAVAG